MATIALPSTFRPETFSMRLSTNQRTFASPFGGSEQTVDLLNDRWTISMTLPRRGSDDQASIEAFMNAMRGMTNTCNLWHFKRRQPRGTMRGTPICNYAPQGSASLTFPNAGIGATLLAGDLVGISGLLLMVQSDCAADGGGSMVVPLVNRIRTAITGGAAVTWDKPTVPFRMLSTGSVNYQPGYADGVSLDFAEVIA